MHKEGLVAWTTVIVKLFLLRLVIICVLIEGRPQRFVIVRDYFEKAVCSAVF